MPDERREPRTSITLPMSAVKAVDKLPDDHPAFEASRMPWRCRRDYSGHVNRSARIEAVLAYAAMDPVASPKTRTGRKSKTGA